MDGHEFAQIDQKLAYGDGEDAIAWLDSTGLGDRNRPLREALVAAVHGEEHLRTVAPEVREAAESLRKWLASRRSDETTDSKTKPGKPRRSGTITRGGASSATPAARRKRSR